MTRAFSRADVAALLRIAGGAGDVGPDPHARRRHVLGGLLELVGGCGAACVEMESRHLRHSGWAVPGSITLAGAITSHSELTSRYLAGHLNALDPCVPLLLGADRPVVTLRRADMMGRAWFDSDHYNVLRRPHGLGESLYGTLSTPDGRRLKVTLHRERNDKPFSERDLRVVHVFHQNLAGLYAPPPQPPASAGPPTRPCEGVASLPPRLRPVLRRLLAGDAVKQAALHLGLSPHTVHEYTKSLYRTFGVNSRGELLARFIPGE